jgi:aminoglycoside 3-N-acetyltransferase
MTNLPNQIYDDLLALGVRPGGVLMVHASLRALGNVPGGAETVIRGLLAALGEDGTLLMPALTYERVTPQNPVFDVHQTPSNVGIIPETFRKREGTRRSVHPTHSVCALGPLTAALLDPHSEDNTPCGPHSPFHTLPHHNGQILMLGCGLEPNTSMHAIEELVVPPYLYNPPIEYTLTLADGSTVLKTYTPHNFRGWQQRYERIEHILAEPALRRGSVLAAEAFLMEAAALWDAALPALRRDPLYFVAPIS